MKELQEIFGNEGEEEYLRGFRSGHTNWNTTNTKAMDAQGLTSSQRKLVQNNKD